MTNAWLVASMIGVVAGVVGFFVVLRGASFVAHAVPLSSFAGAAGAGLVGIDAVAGLAVFAPIAALGIGWLSRRRRSDVVTALVVAAMLGLGALFLSWSSQYASAVYGLLFGDILGVSSGEVWLTAVLAVCGLAAVAVMYRPLLLSSVSPEAAAARGVRTGIVDMLFLVLVSLTTTMSVPVVGALLMFALMVGPPAAARAFTRAPARTMAVAVGVSVATVWTSIVASYLTTWPIGFFVGVFAAAFFLAGSAWTAVRG
ncbi:MAG TPA: metal ABC transporter permease [Acidimicrobiales bacterium]|nr:metal ABC transporter permease [Acidimicrobiales bacterium]